MGKDAPPLQSVKLILLELALLGKLIQRGSEAT
jgi:hypothetical protein